MAKGMRVKLNYEIGRDPDTGVEVTRLTPPEVTCHRNYFTRSASLMTAVICCSPERSMVTGTITCWICRTPKPYS